MFRKKSMTRFLLLVVMCTSMSLVSCEYVARFIIRIDEGANFPCIGVYSFTFIVDALEESQRAFSSETTAETGQLFWRTTSEKDQNKTYSAGSCKIPRGILLKNIPYGGRRKLIVQARDSSGYLVASGASPAFTLEPRGDDVKDLIAMDLVRGCESFDASRCTRSKTVSLGTLIISFPPNGGIPDTAGRLFFQSPAVAAQNLPKIERKIPLPTDKRPDTIILTNIPVSGQRSYTLHAINTGEQEILRWSGTFSTPQNLTPTNASIPIKAAVATSPSP